MMSIRRAHVLFLVLAVTATTGLIAAAPQSQPASPVTAPLTQTIPIDADITTGTLANGLRYYVRSNGLPEKRAELRLVVNAGSILEDNDQLGLAHFVEHMAFNGTKNFPKQEIVTFMESIGMRFGPSVNAFTSFDETVYMLQVPTDKPDVLARSMLILEDWAHNVSFDPAEIDKERGVIVEEWRLGRGAATRLRDQQFPVLLKDSRYATRLPIGTREVIETFKHDRLRQFYTDWYRPDLMAVVAVGDFDKAVVEGLIKKHFAPIPAAGAPRPRVTYPVPDQPGTLYTVATDKETTTASIAVYTKSAARDQTTVGAYRQQLVDGLFGGMLSARYSELSQKADAPFLGASASRGQFVRSKQASTLSALVKEDGIERGLEALFTEAERVTQFGFTAPELARQKANLLRAYERSIAEKDKRQSAPLADEYVRNYTDREPIPGIVYEHELVKRFLPEITLAEINALSRDWAPDNNRVVVIGAPDKPGLVMPDGARLAGVIKGVAGRKLTPYVDTTDTQPLLDVTPTGGSIVKTTARAEFGITEWELSNGVKVLLSPTTFKQDEIVFRAFSPGGTSLASDADFIPAETASTVVGYGGLGRLGMIDLDKALTGKVARANPLIGELEEGVTGSASPKDLETLFQLIYMRFTQPRADPVIFGVLQSQLKSLLTNQAMQPEAVFSDMLQVTLAQNHLRARPMTVATLDAMNLEKSLAFYKDRFADAGDFTFVFVGSFTVDAMKPFVERYLASLPSAGRKETWKDVGMRPPTGVVERRVEKGAEPKSQTRLIFTGPMEYNQEQRVALRAMSLVLETRLREILREELGGTYSVSVGPSYEKFPRQEYSVMVGFGSGPDRADALAARVLEEITTLRTNGPTETQVADARTGLLREMEINKVSNSYLLTNIYARVQSGEDLKTFFEIPGYYERLTPAAIRDAARTYLKPDNYVKVVLVPEKK